MATVADTPSVGTDQTRERLLRALPRPTIKLTTLLLVVVVVYVWGMAGTDARPATLAEGVPNIIDFISRLMPPEFEFEANSERAYTLFPFSSRVPETVVPRDRLSEADPVDEEALAALSASQFVEYLYRGADRHFHYTPDGIEGEIEELPFILEEGEYLYIDPDASDPYILPEGTRFVERYVIPDGQQLVGRRYVINEGEIFLGWPIIVEAIIETIQMALIGTTGAIFLSIPFALLAARNVSPYPIVYQTTRLLLNANRAVPELIYALIMVAAVGLGPFPGVMALMIGSIGSMGKLFAESIEAIDPTQVAAVRATGASQLQVFNYSVLPQAFPMMASYSLLLFESNVRAATILGYVGAGGIGLILQKYYALFQYQRLMGAVLGIIIFVTLIDRASDYIRKRII